MRKIFSMTAAALAVGLMFAPVAHAQSESDFPATGQTTCWDSSGSVIPCAGTGQDGDIRAGARLRYTSRSDGTITDRNTGLVWEKKTNTCPGIHCWTVGYTWDQAFTVFIATLNTAPCFAGHCDWRLPNVKELQSIVNYGNVNPAVSPAFNTCPSSCTAASGYWTSSSYVFSPAGAWFVLFGDGFVFANNKSNFSSVRAVRGGL